MKKLFYAAMIAFATMLTITGCTEEEVTPKTEDNGGGSGSTGPY